MTTRPHGCAPGGDEPGAESDERDPAEALEAPPPSGEPDEIDGAAGGHRSDGPFPDPETHRTAGPP